MTRTRLASLMLLGLFAVPQIQAATLSEVYELAVENDPELAAAQAAFNSNSEIIALRRSSILPRVTLQGNTADTRRRVPLPPIGVDTDPASPTFGELIGLPGSRPTTRGNSHGWSASLSQPVFRLDLWYELQRAKNIKAQALAQFAAAEQDLIVRVTESYLAILEAQAGLTSTTAERDAVQRQLEQVTQRFDVGLVAITDVLESQAAYDSSTVNLIEREGAQSISFESLLRLTGQSITEVSELVDELPITYPEPNNVDAWIQKAIAQNFALVAAREGLVSSRKAVQAARAQRLPSVNASVSWSHNATTTGDFFGSKSDNRTMALSVNMPLFMGGAISSSVRQAGFNLEQAQKNYDLQQRTVVEQTRSLFTAINTDVARVKARLRGIQSSQSALDATQTGYEVGTRNIVEVLQAQRGLYVSIFQHASARYQYIRDNLRLKQTVGSLGPGDIQAISNYIDVDTVKRVIPTTR